MAEKTGAPTGAVFNLADHVDYADGSVVSKTLLKKNTGTITLFSFAAGQGLSEHTAPFDVVAQILVGRNADHAGSCSPCFACCREVQNVAGYDPRRIAYLSPEPFGLAQDKPCGLSSSLSAL